MRALGIYGSPRKNGNTGILLDLFLSALESKGADASRLRVHDLSVSPCLEYTVCEKTGHCPIQDDMEKTVLTAVKRSDLIVLSAPVFFYGIPAGLKALIDRSQILWARKNRLGLNCPGAGSRKGFLLSAGATKGEHLFQGMILTAEYFFDAAGAEYAGSLTYRSVERPGDINSVETLEDDIETAVSALVRKKGLRILTVSLTSGTESIAAAAALKESSAGIHSIYSLGPVLGPEESKILDTAGRGAGLDMMLENPDYLVGPDGGVTPALEKSKFFDFVILIVPDAEASGARGASAARLVVKTAGITAGQEELWNGVPASGPVSGLLLSTQYREFKESAKQFLDRTK